MVGGEYSTRHDCIGDFDPHHAYFFGQKAYVVFLDLLCLYLFIYTYMYICIYAYVYMRICMYSYMYTHVHTRILFV